MSFVIGISAYYHESSLALFENGKLVFFSREEYFSRIKADISFPRLCLNYCIKEFDLSTINIDRVVFYEKPLRSFLFSSKIALKNLPSSFWLLINNLMKIRRSGLFFYSDVNKIIRIPSNKISYCPHHLSHVYSTFPFIKSDKPFLSLVIDGFGDVFSTSAYVVSHNKAELIHSIEYPNSIGLAYSAITEFLGFRLNDGEFKVMALAAYGDGSLDKKFQSLCQGSEIGKINIKIFKFFKSLNEHLEKKFFETFGKSRDEIIEFPEVNSIAFKRHANIAHAIQSFIEINVKDLIELLMKKSKLNKIQITGGVALNSKLISSLNSIKNCEEIFVPANPGDSGAAIGAGVFGCIIENHEVVTNNSPFLGPILKKQDDLMSHFCKKINKKDQAYKDAALLISKGEVIAIFNGRPEVGPRALGNRSIVCDPRNENVTFNLSTQMKKRESFRPLAPAVLEEHAMEWFDFNRNIKKCLNWMGALVQVKLKTKKYLKSICHVDGSARIQIVKKDHSNFYKLIIEFKKLTNIPMLVNTSLNCGGDPIVMDETDLISSMIRMKIKYVINNGSLWRLNEEHLI